MTKAQRREHKRGNQLRKLALKARVATAPKPSKAYWAQYGLIQDGKYIPALV